MERGDKVIVIKTGKIDKVKGVIPAFGGHDFYILSDGCGYSANELKYVEDEDDKKRT